MAERVGFELSVLFSEHTAILSRINREHGPLPEAFGGPSQYVASRHQGMYALMHANDADPRR